MPTLDSKTNLNDKVLPIVAAVVGHSIWGFSYLFTSIALRYTEPDIMLTLRFTLAFIILNLMILTGKFKISLKGKPVKFLFLFSFIEPLYFFFESYGILYTNVTYSGVVLSLVPIAAMLLAIIFLKEYPTKKQVAYCTLPIIGVIMITLSGSKLGVISPLGVILLLLTLFCSACYRTVNRKIASQFTAFERTYFMLAASASAYIVFSLIKQKGDLSKYIEPLHHIEFVIPLLLLSVFCSVLCYTIVNFAVGKMSVITLAVYGSLTTICSMFAGVIFLGEPLTPLSFFASILIIFGILQVTRAAAPEGQAK